MKIIQLSTAAFMFIGTVALTVSLIAHNLPVQATSAFCLGAAGLVASLLLILNEHHK